jgi:hypothetical protein
MNTLWYYDNGVYLLPDLSKQITTDIIIIFHQYTFTGQNADSRSIPEKASILAKGMVVKLLSFTKYMYFSLEAIVTNCKSETAEGSLIYHFV